MSAREIMRKQRAATMLSLSSSSSEDEKEKARAKQSRVTTARKTVQKLSSDSASEDKTEKDTEESADEGKYKVKKIDSIKFPKNDDDYKERKAAGVVLGDDFLADRTLRFVTEWDGFPKECDFTQEPLKNLHSEMYARRSLMKMMQDKYFEKEEPKKEGDEEDKEVVYKRNAATWEEFAKRYSKRLTFISAVTDITPLAAEFTDEQELVVRVRVAQLIDSFRRKVVNGRRINSKFPVQWEGSFMFVKMDFESFAEIYPDFEVYRVWGK